MGDDFGQHINLFRISLERNYSKPRIIYPIKRNDLWSQDTRVEKR